MNGPNLYRVDFFRDDEFVYVWEGGAVNEQHAENRARCERDMVEWVDRGRQGTCSHTDLRTVVTLVGPNPKYNGGL